jgi:hypothetical protein
MSIFGSIMAKIFGSGSGSASAATPVTSAGATATAPPSMTGGAATAAAPARVPISQVDVAAVLTKLAAENKQKLDWRHSIVDLMKLLNLDSSLGARKELAQELQYTGDTSDSAAMNIWLHKQVMRKLAENGGTVPDDLKS